MDDTTKEILAAIQAQRQRLREHRDSLIATKAETDGSIAEIDRELGQEPIGAHLAAAKPMPVRRTRKTTAKAATKTTSGKPGRKPDPNSETSKVLAYIRSRKGVSASQVAEALEIETAKASRLIQYHRSRGAIAAQGTRGSMQFFASNGATA